jgi:hypothetical protein
MGEHESESPTRVADSADGRGPGPALVDLPVPRLAFTLCISINAPINAPINHLLPWFGFFRFGHASALGDYLIFVLGSGSFAVLGSANSALIPGGETGRS